MELGYFLLFEKFYKIIKIIQNIFICFGIITLINFSHSEDIEFKKDILTVVAENKNIKFVIELAISPAERSLGLMYRKKLLLDHGMLFIYPNSQKVTMWMKNTLIPLDMIFINANGTIEDIISMTSPKSLTLLTTKNKVKAVLEINGGLCKYLNINKGDKIKHSIFK